MIDNDKQVKYSKYQMLFEKDYFEKAKNVWLVTNKYDLPNSGVV